MSSKGIKNVGSLECNMVNAKDAELFKQIAKKSKLSQEDIEQFSKKVNKLASKRFRANE